MPEIRRYRVKLVTDFGAFVITEVWATSSENAFKSAKELYPELTLSEYRKVTLMARNTG